MKSKLFGIKRRDQRGITLLEYCAGAAILLGIIWGAMSLLGTNVSKLLASVAGWADREATTIDQNTGGSGNGGS